MALLGSKSLILQHIVRVVKLSTDSQEIIKSQEAKGMPARKLVWFGFSGFFGFFFFTDAVSTYHQPPESYCSSLVAYLKDQNSKSASVYTYICEFVSIKSGMETRHFPLV